MGACLSSECKPQFSALMYGLMEKEFPASLRESLGLPETLCQPVEKPYLYPIPKQGTVYDYRFVKEVRHMLLDEMRDLKTLWLLLYENSNKYCLKKIKYEIHYFP